MDYLSRTRIIEGLSLCGTNCHRITTEKGFFQEDSLVVLALGHLKALDTTDKGDRASKFTELREKDLLIKHLGMIVGEASECLEAVRKNGMEAPAEHIDPKDFTHVEEELADIVIRTMSIAYQLNMRLGAAIVAKMDYNENRPNLHGKKF